MKSLINTQASLLAFLNQKATDLAIELNTTLKVVNFDAYVDMTELPDGDLVGLGDLSMETQGEEALESVSLMFVAATQDDANNMRLTKIVSNFYDSVKPEQQIPYLDEQTGEELGMLVCYSHAVVLPVDKNLKTRVLQGVTFTAALIE